MIVIRRQNKSGKSSAESEGSPDEVLIWNFVIETCLCLDSNSQLDKTKDISATFEGGRQWEEKARSADGQFAATEVFSPTFIRFPHFLCSRSLSNSAEGKEKKPTANIRKERARKLKGSENTTVYHFCPQCM